ncbi:hypothetical protein AYO21_09274 [Fonsecaea monophora]|uniref:Uncharacterized protein n=1 Tax=Fonsecaea monophora TaxID=254056 RepID=A0A177EWX1_9EURO|nr:hypothetical protein AYO21_09274 [Fonsecaea monophora]KAH0829910.1 hypothetical protein FOPE_10796 [Fonsecaea pedrosoi]OAG36543.1 hypothetical protein AYO21_09274 [Fonsecaea monophora]
MARWLDAYNCDAADRFDDKRKQPRPKVAAKGPVVEVQADLIPGEMGPAQARQAAAAPADMAKQVANQRRQVPGAAKLECLSPRGQTDEEQKEIVGFRSNMLLNNLVRLEDRIIQSMAEIAFREGRRTEELGSRSNGLLGHPALIAPPLRLMPLC